MRCSGSQNGIGDVALSGMGIRVGKVWRVEAKGGGISKILRANGQVLQGEGRCVPTYHEVNLQGMMNEADMNFIMDEVFINGGRAIREVYDADPKTPVIISTSGTSPCQPCGAREGLQGVGAVAVDDYYRQLIANEEVMEVVDALNLNISDHFNGYGMMDGEIIPNCWTQYDLARNWIRRIIFQKDSFFGVVDCVG
jgi:hypothetical protein